MPFGIAPAALHGMAHADGECATARSAAAAGVLQVVSTVASRSIEDVAAAAPDGPRCVLLYVQRDRAMSRDLVQRAEAAGYGAIALTVDLPVLGYRDEVLRTAFDPGHDAYGQRAEAGRVWEGDMDEVLDMRSVGLTWDHLATIRSWSSLPLVLKGILTAEDARLAVEHGAGGGLGLQPRRPASSTAWQPPSTCSPRSWKPWTDGRRCTSTAVSAAARTWRLRSRWARAPYSPPARSSTALACAGEAGVAHALAIVREETLRTFALLGVRSPGRTHPGPHRAGLGVPTVSLGR